MEVDLHALEPTFVVALRMLGSRLASGVRKSLAGSSGAEPSIAHKVDVRYPRFHGRQTPPRSPTKVPMSRSHDPKRRLLYELQARKELVDDITDWIVGTRAMVGALVDGVTHGELRRVDIEEDLRRVLEHQANQLARLDGAGVPVDDRKRPVPGRSW